MKIRVFLLIFILVGNIWGQEKKDSNDSITDVLEEHRKNSILRMQEHHKNSIKKASRKIKISNLIKSKFEKDEAELRVWMIIDKFGIYWVECFILRKENSQMKAIYIFGFNQPKKFTFKKFDFTNSPYAGD